VLIAGERRSYNANQIFRDESWRKTDASGAVRINPADATELGISEGDHMRCESATGSIPVQLTICDSVQRGVLSAPNGYGMIAHDAPYESEQRRGPALNLLTSASCRDPIAGTPYHKTLPVRLRPIEG
jgi:anaerobic selenocysteine-containing dehydrogenase